MIMFWNRVEVYSGFSMQRCGEIRELLASNGVKYTYKVIDRAGSGFISGRGRTGTFMQKTEFNYEYFVYVHKDDADYVEGLLRKGNF